MKLTKKTINLICDIESIIGNYCWNPNSAYGEGDYIRYPVWANVTKKEVNIETNKKEKIKIWRKLSDKNLNKIKPTLKPEEIETLEYHFGANELVIGRAIIDILEFIEDRYNVDFVELENTLNKHEDIK